MRFWHGLGAVVALLGPGCRPAVVPPPRHQPAEQLSTAASALPGAASSASPSSFEGAAADAALADAAVRNLIDTWLAAQNQGDFARYQALYAERFEGIKRTADFIPELAIDLDAVGRWELLGNQASTLLEPAEAYESGPAIGITALDCPC